MYPGYPGGRYNTEIAEATKESLWKAEQEGMCI